MFDRVTHHGLLVLLGSCLVGTHNVLWPTTRNKWKRGMINDWVNFYSTVLSLQNLQRQELLSARFCKHVSHVCIWSLYGHYMGNIWSLYCGWVCTRLHPWSHPLADLEEQTQVISCLLIHLAGATELVVPSPWLEIFEIPLRAQRACWKHCNTCLRRTVELLAKSAQQASKSCLWKVAAMQRDLRGRDMKQDSLILLVYLFRNIKTS